MDDKDRRQSELFTKLLGHWVWEAKDKLPLPFDRIYFSVAESGIIVEHFKEGRPVKKELHTLKGSKLEDNHFIIPASSYFVSEVSERSMFFGKAAGSDLNSPEYVLQMKKVKDRKKR